MAVLTGASAASRERRPRRARAVAAVAVMAMGLASSAFVMGAPRAPLQPRATRGSAIGLRAEGDAAITPAPEVGAELSPLLQPLKLAGLGMSLLKPLFALEAKLQAGIYDPEEIRAKIEADVNSAPVVVYTYSLSPFCTEAVALLKSLDVEVKEITLAPEWFLMLGEGAAKRAELGEMYGRTSMPQIFIGGEPIGGLAEGTPGLLPLVESGELEAKVKAAQPQQEQAEEFNLFSLFSR